MEEKNGSFDLTSLFVGSQGTLGFISEMILKSGFRSLHVDVAAIAFDDAGRAYDCIDEIEKLGPMYAEYYDARLFAAAQKAGRVYPFYQTGDKAQAVLLVGFDDFSERHRDKSLKKVQKIAAQCGGSTVTAIGVKALDF